MKKVTYIIVILVVALENCISVWWLSLRNILKNQSFVFLKNAPNFKLLSENIAPKFSSFELLGQFAGKDIKLYMRQNKIFIARN